MRLNGPNHLKRHFEYIFQPTLSCAIVAKGIVYDCGGLALKPPAGMYGMKGDMGGAASLAGAFKTLALLNVKPKSTIL